MATNLTTKQPVTHAISVLNRVKAEGYTDIIVALSGGKDSIATLDLSVKVFGEENVHPYYLYWFKLQCEMIPLVNVLKYYPNMPRLEMIPHYGLADILRNCNGRHLTPSLMSRVSKKSMYTAKKTEAIIRSRVGKGNLWIASGIRASDGLHRRGIISKCNCFWKTTESSGKPVHRVYPIGLWSTENVFTYLKSRKLPIPDMMGSNYNQTSGVSITNPLWVMWLKKEYPQDFSKLKKMFPYIEDSIHRDETRARLEISNKSGLK